MFLACVQHVSTYIVGIFHIIIIIIIIIILKFWKPVFKNNSTDIKNCNI